MGWFISNVPVGVNGGHLKVDWIMMHLNELSPFSAVTGVVTTPWQSDPYGGLEHIEIDASSVTQGLVSSCDLLTGSVDPQKALG